MSLKCFFVCLFFSTWITAFLSIKCNRKKCNYIFLEGFKESDYVKNWSLNGYKATLNIWTLLGGKKGAHFQPNSDPLLLSYQFLMAR